MNHCDYMYRGFSALRKAAASGHEKCVDALIKAGADVNAIDVFKNTILMFAAFRAAFNAQFFSNSELHECDFVKCVKYLLQAGTHVNVNKVINTTATQVTLKGQITMWLFAAGEKIKNLTIKSSDHMHIVNTYLLNTAIQNNFGSSFKLKNLSRSHKETPSKSQSTESVLHNSKTAASIFVNGVFIILHFV